MIIAKVRKSKTTTRPSRPGAGQGLPATLCHGQSVNQE